MNWANIYNLAATYSARGNSVIQSNIELPGVVWSLTSNCPPGMLSAQMVGLTGIQPSVQHTSSSYNIAWILLYHVIPHKLIFLVGSLIYHIYRHVWKLTESFQFSCFMIHTTVTCRHIKYVLISSSFAIINVNSVVTDVSLDFSTTAASTWYAPSLERLHHGM